MGGAESVSCGCLSFLRSAFRTSLPASKDPAEDLTLLIEDGKHPAGLLSEEDIERLLSESINGRSEGTSWDV